jgi:predicted PurR-regulated permease PerM
MLFDLAKINYAYLYTLSAAFFKIVPLISTSMLGLLAGLQMFFTSEYNKIYAIILIIVYAKIDSKIFEDVYGKQIKTSNSFFIGMSVFMGYYSFDLQGIFYGPLLVCVVTIIFKLINELDINENNEITVKESKKKETN